MPCNYYFCRTSGLKRQAWDLCPQVRFSEKLSLLAPSASRAAGSSERGPFGWQPDSPEPEFNLDQLLEDEAEAQLEQASCTAAAGPSLAEQQQDWESTQAASQAMEPVASTCSVSAAKRARLLDRNEREHINKQNVSVAQAAAGRAASASAANDLSQLLAAANAAEIIEGPPWVQAAHPTHRLFYFGGFVCCPSCGSLAQRSIARSHLRFACKRYLKKWQSADIRMLASRKLPRSEFSEWPDGGIDVQSNAAFRRIRQ